MSKYIMHTLKKIQAMIMITIIGFVLLPRLSIYINIKCSLFIRIYRLYTEKYEVTRVL